MTNIETTYAGLKLKNPIIVASSGLTDSAAKNQKMEKAGAGAIVLKSLFEEQILHETASMSKHYSGMDGCDYLETYVRQNQLANYIKLIADTKKVCTIPVIASISCYDDAGWTEFAQQIEQAGADAIEVNMMALQTGTDYTYGSFEKRHIEVLTQLKKVVGLPVIIKLGSNLTCPPALIHQLFAHGAAAVVLFNRLYQPDIDIDTMAQTSGMVFSQQSDLGNTLRWLGIASAQIPQLDMAASGGIHEPQDVVKAILAGATAVEICSAIYLQGETFIAQCTEFLTEWLQGKGIPTIAEAKGRLNQKNVSDNSTFERAQFMRYYSSHEQ